MIPVHRYETSTTSVGGSGKGFKRGCLDLDSRYASRSADTPAVKKPRTQKQRQRYHGGHIEVWHKSSEVVKPEAGFGGNPVQTKAKPEHQPAQQARFQKSLTIDSGLSTIQETPGSTLSHIHGGWPLSEATISEQWSREPVLFQFAQLEDPVFSFQCSPPATNLSLSTCNSTPSIRFSSTTHEEWAKGCFETLPSTETLVNSSRPLLLETQDFACRKQLEPEGGELYNDLLGHQIYEDPTSYLTGFFNPDFSYFPCTAPNELAMGGGDHFPEPQQAAFSDLAHIPRPEEECEQVPVHHELSNPATQQAGPPLMPNCPDWTDIEVPAQPFLQHTLINCTSSSATLGQDELCRNEPLSESQMGRKDLPVLLPRQSPQSPQPEDTGIGEKEILTISEHSQDTTEPCTCETQSSPCPSCVKGQQPWVMVTYKLQTPGRPEKKPPKPRARLEEDARRQTCHTRDLGACVRCKIQRVRCVPNSEDPSGPCEGCSRVAQNLSRKVLHHIGCHRYKLQEVVLFRTSGSRVTDRWHSAQVRNVMTQGRTLSVQMMQDFVCHPFTCRIRKMSPTGRASHNDKTTRDWYDREGVTVQREQVADYALADVHQTVANYKSYVRDSVLGNGPSRQPAIVKIVEGLRKMSYDTAVVADVYQRAWDYFCCLPSANETWDFFYRSWPPGTTQADKAKTCKSVSEKEFLLGWFELQFALRHGTGWSWILEESVPKTLASQFPPLRFPPLANYIGTPRIVVGQIDCIRISCVLKPLTKSLLKVLMAWIADRQYNRWMSIFYGIFTLLSELAKATEDAYHHGWYDKDIKGNGPKNAYIIRDIHESANILLAHWHYYNCSADPLKFSLSETDSNARRSKTPLRDLTAGQLATAQTLWLAIRQWKEMPRDEDRYDNKTEAWWQTWCHTMYFADQMIDTDWKPRQVFS